MKAVKFFLAALAVSVISASIAPVANAQEDGNRDENGEVVRGPYLTNGLWDNWFANVGAGLNVGYDNGEFATGFALNVNAGKWFTPSIGARAGFNGITGMDGKFGYLHGDVLWNISNAIGGYKETRLWDFVPYLHAGLLRDNPIAGLEWGAGAGLLNLVRLTDKLDLTLDVRGNIYKRYSKAGYVSTAVGVAVNLGKTNFVRAENWHNPTDVAALAAAATTAATLTAANTALEAEKVQLQEEKEELVAQKEEIADKLEIAETESSIKEIGPASFYFEIGKTVLSKKELEHLDFYIKNVLPNVDGKKATIITGSADKGTGSARRNQYLCEKRAEYLKNILIEKYGIDTDEYIVNTSIVDGKNDLNRAVVISFE